MAEGRRSAGGTAVPCLRLDQVNWEGSSTPPHVLLADGGGGGGGGGGVPPCQTALGHHLQRKLLFALVGLPARGKSYLSHKLRNFVRWRGIPAEIFNAGNTRRKRLGARESGHAEFFSQVCSNRNNSLFCPRARSAEPRCVEVLGLCETRCYHAAAVAAAAAVVAADVIIMCRACHRRLARLPSRRRPRPRKDCQFETKSRWTR